MNRDADLRAGQERNDPGFSRDILLETRTRTRRLITDVAAEIRPGMTEEEARLLLKERLKAEGMFQGWHPPLVRFGPNTLKDFREESAPGTVLGADDIFFFDIGPVWKRHEGDAGETFTVGNDAEMVKAREDVRSLFEAARGQWLAGIASGADLYAFLDSEAQRRGWVLNLAMAGHRLSDFPHAVKFNGPLAGTSYVPGSGLWVLEVQIRHPARPFGAFFEDLLLNSEKEEAYPGRSA